MKTFSSTGGVEKVSMIAGKAVADFAAANNETFSFFSLYDHPGTETVPYFPKNIFRGFNNHKVSFTLASVRQGRKCRLVIISHVKLLLAAYLIKKISPQTNVLLIAHGKEVCQRLTRRGRRMLAACDTILRVSRYTQERMQSVNRLNSNIFSLLPNCLDPFLANPAAGEAAKLRARYGLQEHDMVILTLSRLTVHEKDKGYEKVFIALQTLLQEFPNMKYVFAGKYEQEEKERLDKLLAGMGLAASVIFTGFVPTAELAAHYALCDVYIMPSEKEGFGISFIEAMFYNKPVIAGNRDGSADALLNGRLGLLVDPCDQQAITETLRKVLHDAAAFLPDRSLLLKHFSFDTYRHKWANLLALPKKSLI